MMLCGKDLDAPKVNCCGVTACAAMVHPFLGEVILGDIEVRICNIWKYSIAGTIIDYLELSILK